MKRIYLLFVFIFIIGILAPCAFTQTAGLRSRLENAKDRAAATKKDLKEKKLAAAKANTKLYKAQQELSAATSRLRRAEVRLKNTREDLEETRIELGKARKRLARHQGAMQGRLLALFRSNDPTYTEVVLQSTSFEDFANRAEFSKRIAQRDESVLIDFVTDKRQVEKQEKRLEEKEAEQAILKVKISKERAEVAHKRASAQVLATAAFRDVKEVERQLDAMENEVASVASMLRRAQSQSRSSRGGGGGASYSGSFSGAGRWPVGGRVSSSYGWRIHPITNTRRFHDGVDIAAGYGTSIHSAAAGTVVDTGWRGPYGQVVVVDHGSGVATMYAHCSSINVSSGQSVSKGQVVARVGSTGWSTGPHLHFTVFRNGSHVNPGSIF